MSKKYVSQCLSNLEELSENIIEGNISSAEYFEYFKGRKLSIDALNSMVEDWTVEDYIDYYKKYWDIQDALSEDYIHAKDLDNYLVNLVIYGKISKQIVVDDLITFNKIGANYINYFYTNAEDLLKLVKRDYNYSKTNEQTLWSVVRVLMERKRLTVAEYKKYFSGYMGNNNMFKNWLGKNTDITFGDLTGVKFTMEERMTITKKANNYSIKEFQNLAKNNEFLWGQLSKSINFERAKMVANGLNIAVALQYNSNLDVNFYKKYAKEFQLDRKIAIEDLKLAEGRFTEDELQELIEVGILYYNNYGGR